MPNITLYLDNENYFKFVKLEPSIQKKAKEKAIKIIKLVVDGKLE